MTKKGGDVALTPRQKKKIKESLEKGFSGEVPFLDLSGKDFDPIQDFSNEVEGNREKFIFRRRPQMYIEINDVGDSNFRIDCTPTQNFGYDLTEGEVFDVVRSWASSVHEEVTAVDPWAPKRTPFDDFVDGVPSAEADKWRKLTSTELKDLHTRLDEIERSSLETAQAWAESEVKIESLRAAIIDLVSTLKEAGPALSRADIDAIIKARSTSWQTTAGLVSASINLGVSILKIAGG
jgi:hypothetical protein